MYNPFSLAGKTILITGASSGIGKATAIECSKLGAKVIITGRNRLRLEETFSSMSGNAHLLIEADLQYPSDIDMLIDSLPMLDGVVNNAGMTKTIPMAFISEEILLDVLRINTISPILITQKLLKEESSLSPHLLFLHHLFLGIVLGYLVILYIQQLRLLLMDL